MNTPSSAPAGPHGKPRDILRGIRRRIIASIGVLAGGFILFVLYLAYLGPHFPWYQNLAVGLAILVTAPTIVLAAWISWGIGLAGRFASWARVDDW